MDTDELAAAIEALEIMCDAIAEAREKLEAHEALSQEVLAS